MHFTPYYTCILYMYLYGCSHGSGNAFYKMPSRVYLVYTQDTSHVHRSTHRIDIDTTQHSANTNANTLCKCSNPIFASTVPTTRSNLMTMAECICCILLDKQTTYLTESAHDSGDTIVMGPFARQCHTLIHLAAPHFVKNARGCENKFAIALAQRKSQSAQKPHSIDLRDYLCVSSE